MVTDLINSVILSGLETAVNQVIQLDTGAMEKLQAISGKVVRIHCTLPDLSINIMVSDTRILLTQGTALIPDTTVQGGPAALLKLLLTREIASLPEDKIIITGNAALLGRLQEILHNLDLDWEYHLSRFIGDIPTQMVSDGLSQAEDLTRRTTQSLILDLDEYLHEEKKLFPSNEQLARFYQSVDDLRLRTDRLESRVNKLLAIAH